MNYTKNIRNSTAALLCATTLVGCAEPRKEPAREAYQSTYARVGQIEIRDTCDASNQPGNDGVADTVRLVTPGVGSVAYYEFNDPNCGSRFNSVRYAPMSIELQQAASDVLRSNDNMRYAFDRQTWEYEHDQR